MLLLISPWPIVGAIGFLLLLYFGGAFTISPWLTALIVIIIVAFVAFVTNRVIIAHHRQATSGREGLAGKTALVKVALNPEGTVLVEGELWAAVSESGRINASEEVVIKKVEGLKLWVARKK